MELSPSMVVEVASNSSAGFGIRLAARFIDWVFGVLICYVGGMVGGFAVGVLAATGHIPGEWKATLQLLSPLGVLLVVAGGVLYQVLAEAVGGASLGKLILRLRVTSEDLTPCTFKGALIRNMAWFLDAFLFGLPAWRAMSNSMLSQRYGDQWGRTVVMRASAVPPDSRQSKGLLTLGILSGATVWGILVALSLVLTVK
ncbi:MAG TPA: RDD family protein [Myxococcaceae bacterium]|jgi:uncharacterized RDD family membrane protein YckC